MFANGPDTDDEKDGHANRQSEDVDKRVNAVLAELPDCDEEIVPEHVMDLEYIRTVSRKAPIF
jgi:hypothetical protein